MGLRIPPPPGHGVGADCLACFAPDKTPKYVFVRAWGTAVCPDCQPPANGYLFICEQDPLDPCKWWGQREIGGNTWQAAYFANTWSAGKFQSEVQVLDLDGPCDQMFRGVADPCNRLFDNELDCEVGYTLATGGVCLVTVFIDPIIILLTSGYHFCTIPGILYDKFEVGMDHAIYRIAHRSDKTNVMIYLDKEELEYD